MRPGYAGVPPARLPACDLNYQQKNHWLISWRVTKHHTQAGRLRTQGIAQKIRRVYLMMRVH